MRRRLSSRHAISGLVALVALVLIFVSVLIASRPSVLPPELYDAVSDVGAELPRTGLVLALGLLVALYGLYRAWRTPTSTAVDAFRRSASTDVRSDTRLVGTHVDELVVEARAEMGSDVDVYRRSLRDRLAELVVELECGHNGLSPTEARERIESGEWTRDPRAASFVEPTVGGLSFPARLYRWLFPRRGFDVDLAYTLMELDRYGETDAKYTVEREWPGYDVRSVEAETDAGRDGGEIAASRGEGQTAANRDEGQTAVSRDEVETDEGNDGDSEENGDVTRTGRPARTGGDAGASE